MIAKIISARICISNLTEFSLNGTEIPSNSGNLINHLSKIHFSVIYQIPNNLKNLEELRNIGVFDN